MVATPIRATGDWDLAEECAQDAFALTPDRGPVRTPAPAETILTARPAWGSITVTSAGTPPLQSRMSPALRAVILGGTAGSHIPPCGILRLREGLAARLRARRREAAPEGPGCGAGPSRPRPPAPAYLAGHGRDLPGRLTSRRRMPDRHRGRRTAPQPSGRRRADGRATAVTAAGPRPGPWPAAPGSRPRPGSGHPARPLCRTWSRRSRRPPRSRSSSTPRR